MIYKKIVEVDDIQERYKKVVEVDDIQESSRSR